jgi:hypothetical protein
VESLFDQRGKPVEEYFARNALAEPVALDIGPFPKSTVPRKYPVT